MWKKNEKDVEFTTFMIKFILFLIIICIGGFFFFFGYFSGSLFADYCALPKQFNWESNKLFTVKFV